jgi:hypothetical protein
LYSDVLVVSEFDFHDMIHSFLPRGLCEPFQLRSVWCSGCIWAGDLYEFGHMSARPNILPERPIDNLFDLFFTVSKNW